MSPSIQNLNISLTFDVSRRLERMAQERGDTSEELAALLLEQVILKKGCENTIRVVNKEGRESEYYDPKGLQEIIRRQDDEISWLREEINRLISVHPPVHVIFHGQDGNTSQQSRVTVEKKTQSELLPNTSKTDDSRDNEKTDNAPPQLSEEFSGENFNQAVESSVYSQDLLPSSDPDMSDDHQVSEEPCGILSEGLPERKIIRFLRLRRSQGKPNPYYWNILMTDFSRQ